jgi:hypothetical protein
MEKTKEKELKKEKTYVVRMTKRTIRNDKHVTIDDDISINELDIKYHLENYKHRGYSECKIIYSPLGEKDAEEKNEMIANLDKVETPAEQMANLKEQNEKQASEISELKEKLDLLMKKIK